MDAWRPPHTPGSLGCLRRLKNGSNSVGPGWQETIRSNLSHQQHTRLPLSRSQRPQLLPIRGATFPLPASQRGAPSTALSHTHPSPALPAQLPPSGARSKAQAWQHAGLTFPFSSPHQPAAFLGPRPPQHHPQGFLPLDPPSLYLEPPPPRPPWPSGS